MDAVSYLSGTVCSFRTLCPMPTEPTTAQLLVEAHQGECLPLFSREALAIQYADEHPNIATTPIELGTIL